METNVEFDSVLFTPYLPDDSQVNPRVYGAELAFWLSGKLAECGVVTLYPNFEDWGWLLEYSAEADDEFWLCCGNRDGAPDKWQCFLKPSAKSFFGRNKASLANAVPLMSALLQILENEKSIYNITWSGGP
jgi:hypothetical protein